ncbi:hypothetical protein ACFVRD_43365 [Streptomyces sp. NPDC057908]|uniref:hypothetical protein n=1 Tax=Streptomyces sp. NPDC057908 TaxID=3346276 RepID=UPI0036DFF008
MVTTTRTRRTAVLYGAVALVLALAGCGGGGGDEKPSAGATAAPSPTRTADPDAAEKTAVLAAYRGMSAAEVRTYATGKLDPELIRYADHRALADIKSTLFWYQQQGTVMKGEPKRTAEVTALDTESTPLKAVITDCVDSSGYDKVEKDSGKAAASPSGPRRHLVTSTAQRSRTGPWKIYTSTIERGRTC